MLYNLVKSSVQYESCSSLNSLYKQAVQQIRNEWFTVTIAASDNIAFLSHWRIQTSGVIYVVFEYTSSETDRDNMCTQPM